MPALHVDLQESQCGKLLLAHLTVMELHTCKQDHEEKSVHYKRQCFWSRALLTLQQHICIQIQGAPLETRQGEKKPRAAELQVAEMRLAPAMGY